METPELEQKAKKLRKETLDLAMANHGSHFGAFFSVIEILITLFEKTMKSEDKFILSKGHSCFPLYVLLKERGYNPKICAHPDIDIENKIFCTTGSLGHGLPIAIGMAMARKIQNKNGKIYVVMGDGECQEGTTWESLLLAPRHKLDNLVVIVDNNGIQGSGFVDQVLPIKRPLKKAAVEAGWDVEEIIDGHCFEELISILNKNVYNKPRLIIANTTKGKGVSFMENKPEWHSKALTEEELNQAYEELR